jgi:hypothetical protein
VTALEANNALGRLCQPIDNFALSFVTPLGTDHYNVLAHDTYQKSFGPRYQSQKGLTRAIKQPWTTDY